MNRITWGIGITVVLAAVAGVFIMVRDQEPARQDSQTTGNAAVGANGASSIITYSDNGFVPASLTIAAGTTVTWDNQSSEKLWVKATGSSDTDCPASSTALNECAAVAKGGTYSHTFTTLGTFTYANREKSSDTGTITVTNDVTQSGPINPAATPQ